MQIVRTSDDGRTRETWRFRWDDWKNTGWICASYVREEQRIDSYGDAFFASVEIYPAPPANYFTTADVLSKPPIDETLVSEVRRRAFAADVGTIEKIKT